MTCAPKFIVFFESTLESIHLCLCQLTLTLWNHGRTEEVKEGVNSGASGWGLGLALGTALLLLKLHSQGQAFASSSHQTIGLAAAILSMKQTQLNPEGR